MKNFILVNVEVTDDDILPQVFQPKYKSDKIHLYLQNFFT